MMDINSIGKINPFVLKETSFQGSSTGLKNIFADMISNVTEAQKDSSDKMKDLLGGGDVELHEVMIAGEKAKTALDLLMEIRNKTIDMYRELTRIQM